MYIEQINGPEDVKKLNIEEMTAMAAEMRQALLVRASKHGGHFGPNFGMVEATIAMHYVFESPKDKIVYDVSHQSYPHKMLTGRKDAYLYEEHYDDVSGYTNPKESEYDFFEIGHTSTSVSLACGLAKARDLKKEDGNVIAVIGDGSLSGGEALEGLDYAAELGGNLIIVVNDNDMSIAENHGGLYQNLKLLRETNGQAECNLFRAMGLDYVYVDKGNDIAALIAAFESVKDSKKPVVVHIKTLKGKGYAPAEQNKEQWHWCMPFDLETGKPLMEFDGEDYSDVTRDYLLKKMKEDPSVVTITSATPTVMGFTEDKRKEAGSQFIDVGIAEANLMGVAAGLAATGHTVFASSFAMFAAGRAFEQVRNSIGYPHLNVKIGATHAGISVGEDGATHQCNEDLALMREIPGMVVINPCDDVEARAAVKAAYEYVGPVYMRFGRLAVPVINDESTYKFEIGKGVELRSGKDITIIATGLPVSESLEAAKFLAEDGIDAQVINIHTIKPLDEELVVKAAQATGRVFTVEEHSIIGGLGSAVMECLAEKNPVKVTRIGVRDTFGESGPAKDLLHKYELDAEGIYKQIKAAL